MEPESENIFWVKVKVRKDILPRSTHCCPQDEISAESNVKSQVFISNEGSDAVTVTRQKTKRFPKLPGYLEDFEMGRAG